MDRYKNFKINGVSKQIPFIKLQNKITDKEEIYKNGITRLDILSYKYYKDPNYWWLILLANPEYASLEFNFSENSVIKIPYPLETSLQQYNNSVSKHIQLYGT